MERTVRRPRLVGGLPADERYLLSLAAQGYTDNEIAAHLGRPEGEVRNQMQRINRSLRAVNRVHAVVIAIKRGYLPLSEIPE